MKFHTNIFKRIFNTLTSVFKSWKKVALLLIAIFLIGEQSYLIVTSIQHAKLIKKMNKEIENLESNNSSIENKLGETSNDLKHKSSRINTLQSDIEDKEDRIEHLENQINY